MIIDAIHLYSIEYETETKIAELSLNRADLTQPYILQAAVGLDGGEFAPTFSGTSDNGSVRFYSMTQNDREIGLRLRLNPQSRIKKPMGEFGLNDPTKFVGKR